MRHKPDYTNGIIALHNTDCMEVMAEYPDNYFDLAVVDPPYGIGAGKMQMGSGKHIFKHGDWDEAIPKESYFDELFRVSINQIIWGGNYFTKHLIPSPHWLIWDKKNPNLSFAEGELAWVRSGKNIRIFYKYSAQVEIGGKIHPTQKPVKLYDWIFHNYSDPSHKILDTHLGSGSSAIAAHYFGIAEFVGCEIDEDYFNDACKRIEQQTAQLTLGL